MSISKRKSIVLSIFMVCEIYLQSQYFLVVLVWKRLIEENCRRMYLSKYTYIKNWIRYTCTCSTEYILQCLYNINLSFVKLDNLFLKHMKIHVLIYKHTVHWSIFFNLFQEQWRVTITPVIKFAAMKYRVLSME